MSENAHLIALAVCIVVLVGHIVAAVKGWDFSGWVPFAFVLAIPVIAVSCSFTDEAKERDAKRQAADEAARQPHVVREADGCKVYAFKSGDLWHYFTRCPDSRTTTDTTIQYSVRSGKTTTTKQRVESITTDTGATP